MNNCSISIRREERTRLSPPPGQKPVDQAVFLVTDRQQRIHALNIHEKQKHIEQQIGEVKSEQPGTDRQPQKPCEENKSQNPDIRCESDSDNSDYKSDNADADFEDYKQGQQPTRLRGRLDQRAALKYERNICKKRAKILRYQAKILDNKASDCRDLELKMRLQTFQELLTGFEHIADRPSGAALRWDDGPDAIYHINSGMVVERIRYCLVGFLWWRLISDEHFIDEDYPLSSEEKSDVLGPQLPRRLRLAQPYHSPGRLPGVLLRLGVTIETGEDAFPIEPGFFHYQQQQPHLTPTPTPLRSPAQGLLHVVLDATNPKSPLADVRTLAGRQPFRFLPSSVVPPMGSAYLVSSAHSFMEEKEPVALPGDIPPDIEAIMASAQLWAYRGRDGRLDQDGGCDSGRLNLAAWETQGFLICYVLAQHPDVGKATFRVRRRHSQLNQDYVMHLSPSPPPEGGHVFFDPYSVDRVFRVFKRDQLQVYSDCFSRYDRRMERRIRPMGSRANMHSVELAPLDPVLLAATEQTLKWEAQRREREDLEERAWVTYDRDGEVGDVDARLARISRRVLDYMQ
ncbi:hypothetical protein MAPG_01995 [Magnaporthiopsis poae ATCC 64411]|uniref:Uncharacterized protein n=1 Tax=Magnaporthiopsis poae (strain ATCC 64411 / 73-15) TaxID=644358 RepID=A0A0C4DQ57_MAGP6|nr:hypothetical protein MAPG_01995 [Magnaporthiopsis poae ATCC 64411]